MSFIKPCLITLGLSSASIVTSLTIYGNVRSKQLYSILDEKQRIIYDLVKIERAQIYINAYLLSLAIAMFYAYMVNKNGKSNSINYCILSLIVQIITLLCYKFYPKKLYLEDYLNTDMQKKQYNIFCEEIKWSYILGLCGGIGLYMINKPSC